MTELDAMTGQELRTKLEELKSFHASQKHVWLKQH